MSKRIVAIVQARMGSTNNKQIQPESLSKRFYNAMANIQNN